MPNSRLLDRNAATKDLPHVEVSSTVPTRLAPEGTFCEVACTVLAPIANAGTIWVGGPGAGPEAGFPMEPGGSLDLIAQPSQTWALAEVDGDKLIPYGA